MHCCKSSAGHAKVMHADPHHATRSRSRWVGGHFAAIALAGTLCAGAAGSSLLKTAESLAHGTLLTALPLEQARQDALEKLSIWDGTLTRLNVPNAPGQFLTLTVPIEGVRFVLELEPTSLLADDFVLLAQVEGGQLVEFDFGPERTYQGTIAGLPGSRVAATVMDTGLYAHIMFPSGAAWGVEPISGRVQGARVGDHIVYREQDVISAGGCGSGPEHIKGRGLPPAGDDGGIAGSTPPCVAEIAIDADQDWFNFYGSVAASAQQIAAILNAVNVQYLGECGIRHRVKAIIVRTTGPAPYTSTNPDTLLSQLRNQWNNNHAGIQRDMVHLFTGKNLDGTVIGIAYVGVVCDIPWAYGLSQRLGNFTNQTDLVAHEIGHNWNANHCTCSNPPYTMNASITGANTHHPTASIPVIVAWRNQANCLNCNSTSPPSCGNPTSGNCYIANGSPYCNNADCCIVVCAVDPFCCNNTWDSICASQAAQLCGNCGDAGAGNCYIANGSPGCNNSSCCATVCAADPFCCNNTWDSLCASAAATSCGNCGDANAGSCYEANGTPGCNNSSCCATICAADPFCCNTQWDSLCASAALNTCTPANNTCANAIEVFHGTVTSGNLTKATNNGSSTCGSSASNRDVWYKFTATRNGTLTVTTCGTHDGPGQDNGMDTVLSVHTACPGNNGNQVLCNDDTNTCGSLDQGILRDSAVSVPIAMGQTLYIRVTHFSSVIANGAFTLRATFQSTPPANDDCANAIPLSCGSSVLGTTRNATLDPQAGNCGTSVTTPGVWYTLVGTGGPITLTTCSNDTNYDTKLSVYTGSCASPVCVTGNDDWNACPVSPLHSRVEFNSLAGVTYRVLVHGFGGQTGEFRLTATCGSTQQVHCICNAEYAVGDRVTLLVDNPDGNGLLFAGHQGTVVCGSSTWNLILISWDGLTNGHAGNGGCQCPSSTQLPPGNTTGWWVECNQIAPAPQGTCPADLNNSGAVDVQDLLILLGAWGPCPDAYACNNPGTCGGGFGPCGIDPGCVCATRYNGTGVCVDASTSCAGWVACPTGNCPPGEICVVNSCCSGNLCLPASQLCSTSFAPSKVQPGELTITGYADGPGAEKPEIKK